MPNMKISDAMRLGAMLRPNQAFDVLFDKPNNATCALGAVAEAIGVLDLSHHNNYIKDAAKKCPKSWHWITRHELCPACQRDYLPDVQEVIKHLNNDHRWSREQIADWVATIEPQDVPEVVPELVPASMGAA